MSNERTSALQGNVQPKLLKDYLKEVMSQKSKLTTGMVTIFSTEYSVDIVRCDTGEIYFSGDIRWIVPEFVSDKLLYDSEEYNRHTIYIREVE